MSAVKKVERSGKQSLRRYINRELSWLEFNARVLAEAENPDNPLLERAKFLAIFESNLDEFYMVRVSGLIELDESGIHDPSPDGMTPAESLAAISREVPRQRSRAASLWTETLLPALAAKGIVLVGYEKLSDAQRHEAREYFESSVFPLCTPLLLDPAITFPFISNRSLNLAVALSDTGQERLARIKIPPNLPRFYQLKSTPGTFLCLEDIVSHNLDLLFPGVKTTGAHRFRVIRDADIEIREIEAADLITAVEEGLQLRRFGDPVLLEYENTLSPHWTKTLMRNLALDVQDTLQVEGLVGFDSLWELYSLDRPDLKFPAHTPFVSAKLSDSEAIFAEVRQRDVLLHHPYDSFRPIEDIVASAAEDPSVVGIKMTLYRVGAESPVVTGLLRAAQNGKQVAAMLELKARFDEGNNLVWSRALERAGVHVTYGFPDKKVHCKLCLIVRQERDRVRSYVHIGTGNYNPSTSRMYTDFGLLTCDQAICQDVIEVFNFLTGFSKQSNYRKLLVAPVNLREAIIERIEREIHLKQTTGTGRILFKLNSLVDPEVIDALYEASQAGIEVKLAVRGICCLRPGVKGLSENIEVGSIVGRFLEHGRIYYFENGGAPDVWIGSADMMRRNLDRRIEVLAPVENPKQVKYLRDQVLLRHFEDTRKRWSLDEAGKYTRCAGGEPFELQTFLMNHSATQDCL